MRISDWSSDVCSSDLIALPNQNAWSTRLSVSCRREPGDGFHERFHAQPARMLLTQGFIARHADGGTAILGRGGSDTSAAYFGALLGAQRVEIWTRSEEHTSELQSLMRNSTAAFCLKQ